MFYSITATRERRPDWFEADLKAMFDLLAEGSIKPVIWKRLRLSEAKHAHHLLEQAKPIGKIILEPGR